MKSLKLRLLGLAALVISAILIAAGVAFHWQFRAQVESFVLTELSSHFEQIAAGLDVTADGKVEMKGQLSDPRFQQPAGGLYWQVDVAGQESLTSRSLWNEALHVPTPPNSAEENHAHVMALPFGGEVFALEKMVALEGPNGTLVKAVITVGLDRTRVNSAADAFAWRITAGLLAVYAALLVGTFAIMFLGLAPLQSLKRKIAELRGDRMLLEPGEFPSEVFPLISELNAMTEARETQLKKARERAANLAHGLKTPLAVIGAIADELDAEGRASHASEIRQNVGQMKGLVDRELTRSRMSGLDSRHTSNLEQTAQKVVATMMRAPRGDQLSWQLAVPHGSQVAMDSTDLIELLGNLADNARKHARSLVRISQDGAALVVEDDGRGVDQALIGRMLQRGTRLSDAPPVTGDGNGIGLSIVQDLAEAYGARLDIRQSELGGLSVRFDLAAGPPGGPGVVSPA
jgi:signal transduction histidine kinase